MLVNRLADLRWSSPRVPGKLYGVAERFRTHMWYGCVEANFSSGLELYEHLTVTFFEHLLANHVHCEEGGGCKPVRPQSSQTLTK